jgi:ubiquinone/menaquinone biosynthesis C-methylase UbiE
MTKTPERPFMPAAGRDLFLPLYDPLTRLFGIAAVHAALLDQAELLPQFRVLDVGCGTGTLAVALKRRHPGVDVVALDPDAKALARAQRKAARAGVDIRFDRGFGDALPYEDGTFSRVFSSMMFHHLRRSERQSTLAEIRRVLEPGGRLEFLDLSSSGSHVHGRLARIFHGTQQLGGNAHDRLLDLMTSAGLTDAKRVGDRSTIVGQIAFYQASRRD